jgi:hypothetical protein
MNGLVGTWTLISYVTYGPGDVEGKPYGEAVGRLSYDAHGNMSGQVMRPGRAPVVHGEKNLQAVRGAYAGYIAYFGTYKVSESGESVVHHVLGALNPSWVGGNQVRRMLLDGDRLVLSADVHKNGNIVRHTLTWQRVV